MAIQSEVFSTSFGVRTFASTKPIATKQHMAVWLKRVSDNVWVQASLNSFELINNSAVLEEAPNQAIYSQIEIRVADEPDELGASQSDISIVASLATSIEQIATDVIPNLPEILLADDNASIATTKASEALASSNASEVSRLASESARDLSLTYSQNSGAFATASSDSALASANSAISANADATTATTQAGIATTKASEASTSASQALGYRNEAKVFRDEAEASALSVDSANLVHKTGDETIAGIKTFSSNIVGNITGNAGTATKLTSSWSDWSASGVIGNVVGTLAWKIYGNGHVIFDASNGTAPNGAAVNNTNSGTPWTSSYPTLMGWNGSGTYGVRVDSARVADSTTYASAFTTAVGSAPSYACRAWVYFDATKDTTGATSTASTNRLIVGSGNIASVLRNAVGDFTITFTTEMPSATYAVLAGMGRTDTVQTAMQVRSLTANSFNIHVRVGSNNGQSDNPFNFIAVFI